MPVLVLGSASTNPGTLADYEAGYPLASAALAQVSGEADLVYKFPYAPVQVEFSKLAAEWEEVERPGQSAILAHRGPQLLRAAFQFRIAHRPSNGLQSIERDMEMLRKIAASPKPVSIVGLGSFFDTTALIRLQGWAWHGVRFRVLNLDISVIRRGPSNEPWQADCDMELVEDRNPTFLAVAFTPFVYADEPIVNTTSTSSGGNSKSSKPAPKSTGISAAEKERRRLAALKAANDAAIAAEARRTRDLINRRSTGPI